MTFKEIVDELDEGAVKPTNRSTISQAITRLMKDHGLVQKVVDVHGDQRQPIVELTNPGIALAKSLSDVDRSLIPKFIGAMNLDKDREKQIAHALERGISNFQKLSDVVKQDFKEQRPNVARIYDYIIGGTNHFAVDRELADSFLAKNPLARQQALASRAFLRRCVRFLAEEKNIKQFIDIGSGLPTVGNTHEIVQDIHPDARVLYVDYDRDAVEASKILLTENEYARAVQADLRNPEEILGTPEMELIDFESPVAVVMVLVLQFIPSNEQALHSVEAFRNRMTKGSCLVIAHPTQPPESDRELLDEIIRIYSSTVTPVNLRPREEILKFLEGSSLLPPGLVYTPLWNPNISDPYHSGEKAILADEPHRSLVLAGVGEF
jgi:hypothetical protein